MKVTEKGIDRLALGLSILVHVALFLFPSCTSQVELKKPNDQYKVPVQLSVVKPTPPPPPKPKPKPKPPKKVEKKAPKSTRGVATNKPVKKPEKPEPPKRLPGDRDTPEVASFSEPVTPKIAINNEWEGTIIVNATIDTEGKISQYDIVQSTGHIELDDAFIRTLKTSYTFKPKRVLGKNVVSNIQVKHTFEP
jgi:protein TonB